MGVVFTLFLTLFLFLFNPITITIAVILIIHFKKSNKYKESAYFQITKYPYLSIRSDKGRYGEYLIYKHLQHMEDSDAKFLFNVYVPKATGETTEIDVLMICHKGIFVFESKNYSGWIFGNENQKYWYQTLVSQNGKSHKEAFYNPIMQNQAHMRHLQTLFEDPIPMHSIVVFSDRCTLKSIQMQSSNISVIKRYHVASVVSTICNQTPNDLLDTQTINEIYSKLYLFTQVDQSVRTQHITNIQKAKNNFGSQPSATVSVKSEKLPQKQTQATCTWCGGNLVLRTISKGPQTGTQIYCCSNYPRCTYFKNADLNKF